MLVNNFTIIEHKASDHGGINATTHEKYHLYACIPHRFAIAPQPNSCVAKLLFLFIVHPAAIIFVRDMTVRLQKLLINVIRLLIRLLKP